MHFRRFRRNPATTAPPPVAVPPLPRAATVPPAAPDQHIYLPTTSEKLRAHAERCLGQIADAQTQISELQDWIAHWRAESADFLRTAELVERDRVASVLDATVRPGAAMCTDELLAYRPHPEAQPGLVNGWQVGDGPHPDEGGPSTYMAQPWHAETQLPDTLTMSVVNGAAR